MGCRSLDRNRRRVSPERREPSGNQYGRGLEWFTAWHRPDTVFDVDAHVGPRPLGVGDGDELGRVRELVQELALLLGTQSLRA